AAFHDLAVHHVPHVGPADGVGGQPPPQRHADRPIKGDPAHHLAVDEALPAATGLPDTVLGLVPMLAQPVHHSGDVCPAIVAHGYVRVREVDGVERLALDVQLQLVRGAVADPDRAGSFVSLEVRQDLLVEVGRAVDAV